MSTISLQRCSNIQEFRSTLNQLSEMSTQVVNVTVRPQFRDPLKRLFETSSPVAHVTELEYRVIATADKNIKPVFHSGTKTAITNFISTNHDMMFSLEPQEILNLLQLPGITAELLSVSAQYRLGKCYQEGLGIEKNAQKAYRWSRLAAEKSHGGSFDSCIPDLRPFTEPLPIFFRKNPSTSKPLIPDESILLFDVSSRMYRTYKLKLTATQNE